MLFAGSRFLRVAEAGMHRDAGRVAGENGKEGKDELHCATDV